MTITLNTTVEQYGTWMDTENKLVAAGHTDDSDLLYMESLYNDIIDLIGYNTALLENTAIDNDTHIGTKAILAMDYVAACIDKEVDYTHTGRILETRFYDACKKLHGCTNIARSSLQDDVLAGTDYFIYGFRVDVTLNDKSRHISANGIYNCDNKGLRCTASIINKNAHNTYPAPVLSLRFSGNTDKYLVLYHLLKEHLTPMLLEFNRMCHVLNYSF